MGKGKSASYALFPRIRKNIFTGTQIIPTETEKTGCARITLLQSQLVHYKGYIDHKCLKSRF